MSKDLTRRAAETSGAPARMFGGPGFFRGAPAIQRKCAECAAEDRDAEVQPKLAIGAPGDSYEREADRVADRIMSGGSAAPDAPGIGRIQRLASGPGRPSGHPVSQSRIDARRGAGRPLPPGTRQFFEPRLGSDLGGVRVHSDPEAQTMARSIDAKAFTYGRDVYFGQGQYRPETPAGQHLLAHELTHVIQQTGSGPSGGAGAAGQTAVSAAPQMVQRREVCDENGVCLSEEGPDESIFEPSSEYPVSSASPAAETAVDDSGGISTPDQTSTPGSPTPAGATMSLVPPGNCIQGIHDAMQRTVKAWCDHPSGRQCNATESCLRIHQKIRRNQMCAQARRTINDTCYDGGDIGHRIAERDARRAQATCEAQRIARCRPPVPVPVPEPVRVPRPVRRPDPDFMDRMAELTGLTGAALIAYLIVSEGSRLFPPRNLIPVP